MRLIRGRRGEATKVTQVGFIAGSPRYGDTATCRVSFARYNTKDEVDTLAESWSRHRSFSHE